MAQVLYTRNSAAVDGSFQATVLIDDLLSVVAMSGDLDLASCAAALAACTSADQLDVVVQLADVEFMDCAGYGALVAAHTTLDQRGGSLVLKGPVGEPLRLLSLIEFGAQASKGSPPEFSHLDGIWSRATVQPN